MKSAPFITLVSLAVFALTACSFSDSSVSISGSSESISKSSTSSGSSSQNSGSSKSKTNYQDDVANLTYSIAGSSMSASDFPNALSRLAGQFKINNWAQEKSTFYGIGKGLKRAGIAKVNIAQVPFLSTVLKTNPNSLQYIQDGY